MHMNKISPKPPPAARPPGRRPRRRWLAAVSLAACLAAAYPAAAAADSTPASAGTTQVDCAPPGGKAPPCYSPRAYQVAYGATDIRKDLAAFDSKFGLPRARLHVVTAIAGSPTPYLANGEELGDAEIVHAFAPGAPLDIILVPADAISSPANFAAAITKAIRESAALHAAVLAISASVGEPFLTSAEAARMHAAQEQARKQHVTILGSSGDGGAISSHPGGPPVEVNMPASDPLVLGVGGTVLDASPGGTYLGEMAWNDNTEASGGGYSSLFGRPPYQAGLARARFS